MTDDNKPDLFEAARLRDEGIRIAEAHANAVVPDWADLAYTYLHAAIAKPKFGGTFAASLSRFQTTDFRKWAENRGLPKPPDPRAYGGVIRRAVKAGKLVADGYAPKADPSSHCCPAVIWRVVEAGDPEEPEPPRDPADDYDYAADDRNFDAAREDRIFGRYR